MRVFSLLGLAFFTFGCGGTQSEPAITTSGGGEGTGSESVLVQPEGARLPAGVAPTRYHLDLSIDPRESRFNGIAMIDVQLDTPTRVIWMHGRSLAVTEVSVRSGEQTQVGTWTEQEDDDSLSSLVFDNPVSGSVTLRFAYDAPFNEGLEGLYRVDSGGHAYAFTQMEPLSARLAFPCFDEPRFKTPFDVTLRTPEGDTAIANSGAVQSQTVEGTTVTTFRTSEPLPTYLIAFAVGPLDVVEGTAIAPNDVRTTPLPFRGVAPRGRGPELAYALEHTPALLTILEDYFGIPYPYDKLDIIAVPDFGAGAMENAGAVTFRDSLLLVSEENSDTRVLRYFAYIMAHELAHMWFGNLVTMEWWDDLWLNEAFASWIEHVVVAEWNPSYEADVELSEWVNSVMSSDALASARQIRQPIQSSHDIHNAFDGITYGKGAGVLRMVERHTGSELFRDGIRHYLTANRFGSATFEDFVSGMEAVIPAEGSAPSPTSTILRSFVEQPGIPFVEASFSCEDNHPVLTYRQSRYLPHGSTGSTDQTWQVPFCARYGAGMLSGQHCEVLTAQSGTVNFTGPCTSWTMPNADGAGYYRWSLPPEQLAALSAQGLRRLSTTEKLAFSDSLQAAFNGNRTPGGEVLDAMLSLASDRNRSVSESPHELFGFVYENVLTGEARDQFRTRVVAAYQPAIRRLRWRTRSGESQDLALQRGGLARFLVDHLEHEGTINELAQLGNAYLTQNAELSPDLQTPALVAAARIGDAAVFDALMAKLQGTEEGRLRRSIVTALGSVQDPALASRARELVASDDLRSNERLRPLGGLLANASLRAATWAWLKENFERVVAALPPAYAGYLPELLAGACTEEMASDVESFFGTRVENLPGGPGNLRQSVESIRLCSALATAQREHVQTWLD